MGIKLAMALIASFLIVPQILSAADAGATEGETMEFTVTLEGTPNGFAIRYKYKTSEDSSAVEGDDYESTSGTVTFNSGVKTQKISVDTIDDSEVEDPEVFNLKLYDQEVNGLYRGVTGWVTPTSNLRQAPRTITLRGQIQDNDGTQKCENSVAGNSC